MCILAICIEISLCTIFISMYLINLFIYLSKLVIYTLLSEENRSLGFPTRFNKKRPVLAQKKATSLKLWIKEEEFYYKRSKNKGA